MAKARVCRHGSSSPFKGVNMWHAGPCCSPSVACLRLLGGDSVHKPCVVPDAVLYLQCTWLAPTKYLLNTCLKHPCLVGFFQLWLGVLGWSGGKACLPRLCTLAGTLAQKILPGGYLPCHTGGLALAVHTEAYIGHQLLCTWICLWS